jgi:WD40 repeat protein
MQTITFPRVDPDAEPAVLAVQFAADGHSLAAVLGQPGWPASVRWWDFRRNRQVRRAAATSGDLDPDAERGYPLPALSADLTRLAVYGTSEEWDECVTLFRSGKTVATVELIAQLDEVVRCLAVAPDGSRVVFGGFAEGFRREVLLPWDADRALGRPRRHEDRCPIFDEAITPANDEPVSALAFSGDGRRIASGNGAGEVGVWEWPPRNQPTVPRGSALVVRPTQPQAGRFRLADGEAVHRIALSADGRRVGAASAGTVQVWDVGARKAVGRVDGEGFHGFDLDPTGRSAAIACEDGTVRLIALPGRKVTGRFDWDLGPLTAVAFAPDGLRCAAGGADGRVVVWDLDG